MIYADYAFYTKSFFGKAISEEDFDGLSLKASRYLDYVTQGKAEAHSDLDALKMCCCALAEQYQMIEAAEAISRTSLNAAKNGDDIQSETVGSWSRAYRSAGESAASAFGAANEAKATLYSIVMEYLSNTGLLYRGTKSCRYWNGVL